MTDFRRTLLWVVFSMSIFLIWDGWNKHNGRPSLLGPKPVATAASAPGAAPGTVPAGVPAVAGAPAVPGAVAPAAVPAAPSEQFVVTTDLVKATIESHGGTLSHVELLLQRDNIDPTKNVKVLDQTSGVRLYLAQTAVAAAGVGTAKPDFKLPMTIAPTSQFALKDGVDELHVQLESADLGGLKLIKTYTFKRGDYVIGVKQELRNTSAVPLSPQVYLQLVRDGNPPPGESKLYSTFTGPVVHTDAERFMKLDFEKIANGKAEHAKSADNGWVAMVQHYFASAWLVGATGDVKMPRDFYSRLVDTNQYAVGMVVPVGTIEPNQSKVFDARLFVGPQEEDKLKKLAPDLELVKDYGMFKLLSEPLFWLLTFLHKILNNWGWAIVALVVVLKAAFYWLNAYAYRSMGKMKAVNPKIMEMRERLKDKPQQLQQEMMRIYKEEGVNPIGGCLPILVQMPFFIALYWVLLSSVEMRNAPWIGWITDLSAADPYFILPILMTLSSLLQTWLNPTPPDPMQAKMMWIMPLVFSIMFFFFPAGLVLYWLTNNLLSIAQQYLINKQLGVLGK
ncbi:MAG: hypothetical protein RLZZ618_4030 [Pseudomonadota bacterium]